jgi:hypothetical protein
MAQISICDLCKQPKAEIEYRLSVFKRIGKKHSNKAEAEICEDCHKLICESILAHANQPKIVFGRADCATQIPPRVNTTTSVERPEEVASGVFKVPSHSPGAIKKLGSRTTGVKEETKDDSGNCKHNNKTMDDDTLRVICKDCKRPVED